MMYRRTYRIAVDPDWHQMVSTEVTGQVSGKLNLQSGSKIARDLHVVLDPHQ